MTNFIILGAVFVMNVIAFILYYDDKQRAIHGDWRISEHTLILFSLLFGAFGALLAMYVFRHKTKHLLFVISVPAMLVMQVGILIFLFVKFL